MIVAADIFSTLGSAIGNLLGGAASSAAAGIITVFAHAVLGSLTKAIEWLSTVWITTPTPALADGSGNPVGTVAWMQSELLPLTTALAVGSVIVGGAKIAIADAGHGEAREFTKWLFVFVLASTGGVAFAAMMITTFDGFAGYIISQATVGSNFGDHLAQGLGLATQAVGSATLRPDGGFLIGLAGTDASAMLAIVIGLLALIASFVEFVLMVFRGGVLVILCGLIPLAAAFSNLPTGERWLRRIAGWIVALALYKLAAAFCYAAAFRLSAGTNVIGVMDGLALLIVSVLALPVLLRLTLPAAEHFTLHRGAAASARTAAAVVPNGALSLAAGGGSGAAMAAGRQFAGAVAGAAAGDGSSGAGPAGASRPAGAAGQGATGANGSSGAGARSSPGAPGSGGAKGADGAGGQTGAPGASSGGGIPGASTSFGAPLSATPSGQETTSGSTPPVSAPKPADQPGSGSGQDAKRAGE